MGLCTGAKGLVGVSGLLLAFALLLLASSAWACCDGRDTSVRGACDAREGLVVCCGDSCCVGDGDWDNCGCTCRLPTLPRLIWL